MSDDIHEIKADIKELVKQGAVHNELLRTHEQRSIALQAAQAILHSKQEKTDSEVSWHSRVFKLLGAILVGAVIQFVVRSFT